MNKTWKILSTAVLIIGGVWLGSLLNTTASGAGGTGQPGTSDDPVVTKSYVDQQIQKVLGGGTTTPTPAPTVPTNPPNNGAVSTSNAVVIVDVKPGEKLIAEAGAEFIVRNGKAIIYSLDANGVADLTDGKDIVNGQAIVTNHLLSFPRDGRGITVQDGQKYGLVVMVRGGYSIQ
ncbi:hypothetical protein ACP8HI_25140 [Paenibacillus sp. FA6]|uniref:hypothetical protein n=1 Tax=Paenibacillus sp. FA6 TaxID=3413029 RepID=UPI003F65D006